MEDPLKVLCDEREVELKFLEEQLRALQNKLHQDDTSRKMLLLEIGIKETKNSLAELQAAIVAKTEEIVAKQYDLDVKQKENIAFKEILATEKFDSETLEHANKDLDQRVLLFEDHLYASKLDEKYDIEHQTAILRELQEVSKTCQSQINKEESSIVDLKKHKQEVIIEKDKVIAEKAVVITSLQSTLEELHKQCQAAVQTVQELSKENQKLSRNILSKKEHTPKTLIDQEEVDNLQAKFLHLQRRLNTLIVQNRKNHSVVENLDKENKMLNNKYQAHNQFIKCHTLIVEDEALQKMLAELKNQLRDPKNADSMEELKNQIAYLENQSKNFKSSELKYKIAALEEQLKDFKLIKQKNKDLQVAVSELRSQRLSVFFGASNSTAQVNQDFIDQLKVLEAENELHKKELLRVNCDREHLECSVTAITNEASKLKKEVELNKQREDLLLNLQERAAVFEQHIQQNEGDILHSYRGNLKNLIATNDAVKQQMESILREKEDVLKEKLSKDNQKQLDEMQNQVQKLEKDLRNCMDHTQKLKERCKLKSATVLDLEKKVEEMSRKYELNRAIFTDEVERWQKRFETLLDEINALNLMITECESYNVQLKEKIGEIKNELHFCKRMVGHYKALLKLERNTMMTIKTKQQETVRVTAMHVEESITRGNRKVKEIIERYGDVINKITKD